LGQAEAASTRGLRLAHFFARRPGLRHGYRIVDAGHVARILRERYPDRQDIPSKPIADWMMWLAARGNPMLRYVLFELGRERRCPSAKAERLLGWRSRPPRDSVVGTAESIFSSLGRSA
jgi:dihydroflavonol-4-reductase